MLTDIVTALRNTGRYKQAEVSEGMPDMETEADIIDAMPSVFVSLGDSGAEPNEVTGRTVQTVTDTIEVVLICESPLCIQRQQEAAQTCTSVKNLQFVGAKNWKFTPRYVVRCLTFTTTSNYLADA